jgi:hypothetical protein
MQIRLKPAFYTAEAGGWRDYISVLHFPYTGWHLSYVVLGAAVAPSLHLERTGATLLAFLLAVGVAAHALDERHGRPLRTGIPDRMLLALASLSLGGAAGLGVLGSLLVSFWLLPFVAFGLFIVVAYNLELWGGRFHSDFWFGLAWGAFPLLTAYWINALSFGASAILLGMAAFTLTLAQRALSNYVRGIRRRVLRVDGTLEMADGTVVELDGPALIAAPERALRLLALSMPLLAGGLVAFRLLAMPPL